MSKQRISEGRGNLLASFYLKFYAFLIHKFLFAYTVFTTSTRAISNYYSHLALRCSRSKSFLFWSSYQTRKHIGAIHKVTLLSRCIFWIRINGLIAVCMCLLASDNDDQRPFVHPRTSPQTDNYPGTSNAVIDEASADLREAYAKAIQLRNEMSKDLEIARAQTLFWFAIALILVIGHAWLAYRWLRNPIPNEKYSKDRKSGSSGSNRTPKTEPLNAAASEKKNATITIRNSQTQNVEIVEHVATRGHFKKDGNGHRIRSKHLLDTTETGSLFRAMPPPPATPATATKALLEISHVASSEGCTSGTNQDKDREHNATYPSPDSEANKGNALSERFHLLSRFTRRGFSLLEIMISLAILTTILSSVIASLYTLHRSRILARECSESQEIGRLFIERIMAEPWSNLHSPHQDDFWRASYASDKNSIPLTASQLVDAGMLPSLPSLDDLKVFVEYYPWSEAELALNNSSARTTPSPLPSRDRTMSFRIVVDWRSITGNRMQNFQWFVRSE